jgi:hypothetical protein
MNDTKTTNAVSQLDQALSSIRQALVGLRFGMVSVIVQDGVVVQIERTERNRLTKSDRST